jgi:hypothetical protein
MKNRPSLFAMLLAGAFVGSLIGTVLADSGVHLTLLENDEETIDTALEDKQPGPLAQSVYISSKASVTNMEANVFVRNPNLWIGTNVDLTAIAAYNTKDDAFGTKFEITAISPIHCLGAAHAAPKLGTKYNFVGADNRTVTRTIAAELNPVDDVEVYLLDRELPPSVTPMRMLPRDVAVYLPPGADLGLPVIFVNQRNWLYCGEAAGIMPGNDPVVVYRAPLGRARQAFNTQVISGDSSFPELVLVNGVPAILSLWHFGGYGAGPLEAAHFDVINAAMQKLSEQAGLATNYQLRAVSLKGIAKE